MDDINYNESFESVVLQARNPLEAKLLKKVLFLEENILKCQMQMKQVLERDESIMKGEPVMDSVKNIYTILDSQQAQIKEMNEKYEELARNYTSRDESYKMVFNTKNDLYTQIELVKDAMKENLENLVHCIYENKSMEKTLSKIRPEIPLRPIDLAEGIFEAVKSNDIQSFKWFAYNNPELINSCDETHFNCAPLHYAAREGYFELVQMLLAQDADVNAKNDNGWTPLHFAAFNGYAEICEMLLRNGAEPNVKNDIGWTPIHYASKHHHLEVIQILFEYDADPSIKGRKGELPLSLAVNDTIKDLLKTRLPPPPNSVSIGYNLNYSKFPSHT